MKLPVDARYTECESSEISSFTCYDQDGGGPSEGGTIYLDNVFKTANGAVNVPIPKGFPARVIMPNGTFRNATHIRLVPGGDGVKTAYPLIPVL